MSNTKRKSTKVEKDEQTGSESSTVDQVPAPESWVKRDVETILTDVPEEITQVPVLLQAFAGEFNSVIPFPLNHSRPLSIYNHLPEGSPSLILDATVATFELYDAILALLAVKDNDQEYDSETSSDPALVLAYNMKAAIDLGYSMLAGSAYQVPEEINIANTVLSLGEMVFDVRNSSLHTHFVKLYRVVQEYNQTNPLPFVLGYSSIINE